MFSFRRFCLYKPLSYSPPQACTFIGQHRNMCVINSAAGVALSSVKRVVHVCSLSVAFILTHRSQSLTKSSWLVDHLGKCSTVFWFTHCICFWFRAIWLSFMTTWQLVVLGIFSISYDQNSFHQSQISPVLGVYMMNLPIKNIYWDHFSRRSNWSMLLTLVAN